MLFGLMIAYWINYAFFFYDGQVQWRFPLLFQCVFAIYVILVTMFMPETPRWLMRHEASPTRGIEVSRIRSVGIGLVIQGDIGPGEVKKPAHRPRDRGQGGAGDHGCTRAGE